jgi:hypothetical protein
MAQERMMPEQQGIIITGHRIVSFGSFAINPRPRVIWADLPIRPWDRWGRAQEIDPKEKPREIIEWEERWHRRA